MNGYKRYEDNAPSADILLAHQKRHYDELNRLYKIEDVLQGSPDVWLSMTMKYDKRHLVTESTDRGGDVTTTGYDGAGRRTTTTDAEGNLTTLTLDANGNVTKIQEQETIPGSMSTETFETQFTYDAINRRLTQKVIDRTNSTNYKLTQWEYDSLNVPVVTTDPKGYETTVQHDALARITQKSVDLGASAAIVTQWTYDQHDNVTVYTDDNGSDTTYAYDDLNRLETKTYEDTETVDFTYDAVGNVTQIIDQNGTDIDQEFDALNRLTARSATLATGVIGDDDEWFAYDGMNRLTEAKDDDSIVQLTYDSLSRILTEKQGENPFGSTAKTVSYTYDNDGNMTQIDYPSGFDAVRTYDDIHRLTAIDDGSSNDIVDFAYYGAGGRVKDVSFGNATTTTNTWDGFRRPTEISHEDSTPTEFAGFTYAWDKNDNPLYEERSHDSGAGDVYTYDQANRLKKVLTDVADPANEVANPGTETYTDKVEWTLDDVHNFTSVATTPYGGSASTVSYTVNSMNEYTAIGATSRTFDANGNLTDDGTYEYEYDFHNHLVEVTLKSSSTTIATYSYDALGRGRRWKKVVGSDTTRFIYHDQHVIEEYDGSDNLLRLFVFGQGWDNIVMMEAPDVADVDSDANTTELKRFYYHRQLKGDVTHITDEDEAVVESYAYTPYGEPTIKDIGGSTVSGSQIGNPFLYTGRRLDEETGLYYYRARHYDPESGRFIQRDPLEYVDGPNARIYVRGRPLSRVDPRGLDDSDDEGFSTEIVEYDDKSKDKEEAFKEALKDSGLPKSLIDESAKEFSASSEDGMAVGHFDVQFKDGKIVAGKLTGTWEVKCIVVIVMPKSMSSRDWLKLLIHEITHAGIFRDVFRKKKKELKEKTKKQNEGGGEDVSGKKPKEVKDQLREEAEREANDANSEAAEANRTLDKETEHGSKPDPAGSTSEGK